MIFCFDRVVTPSELGVKRRTIVPPSGGWLPNTLYVVDVAFSPDSVVHRGLLYTDYVTDGSIELLAVNRILNPAYEVKADVGEMFYIKAVRALGSDPI